LSAAIVEELKLVWVCCGWRMPPTTHSNRYGVTVTSCCSYSSFVLLKMGDSDARKL
jgi:hypothetical protein